MDPQPSRVDNLERLRQKLETNIAKLNKSLLYWKTWEAEHEGLKEELQNIDENASSQEMLDAGMSLEGEVVDEQEMKNLTGYGKNVSRTRAQVMSSVNGRIETGKKNAESVQKQLDVAEEELRDVLVDSDDAKGPPIMDIFEELDDNGNIISSHVMNTQDTADQLEAISKSHAARSAQSNSPANESTTSSKPQSEAHTPNAPLTTPTITSHNGIPERKVGPPKQQASRPRAVTKKVSFAAEPQVSTFSTPPPHLQERSSAVKSNEITYLENPLWHPTERVLELDENDQIVGSHPLEVIVPPSEQGRVHQREALQSMSAIGPIVAEMNLVPDQDDEDLDDDEDYMDDDDSIDEDDFGMINIGSVITDEYRAEMEALMKKHEADLMSYRAPIPSKASKKGTNNANGEYSSPEEAEKPATLGKRGVRFTDDLDDSALESPAKKSATNPTSEIPIRSKAKLTPFSETVVERVSKSAEHSIEPASANLKRPSKFKAGLKASGAQSTTPAPHKASNSKLLSGGLVELGVVPSATIEHEGEPERVSRFKAKRLASNGLS